MKGEGAGGDGLAICDTIRPGLLLCDTIRSPFRIVAIKGEGVGCCCILLYDERSVIMSIMRRVLL